MNHNPGKHTTHKLGLGLAALGRPGYINLGHNQDVNAPYQNQNMEAHTHKVLDKAYEAGISYFDVARSYGKAELFLANWLKSRHIEPKKVTVGSKWGYTYTADWKVEAEVHEVKNHSLEVLIKQWQESRQLLHPYLSLYQIHSATLESGVLENNAVLKQLSSLKNDGIKIGLTLSGTEQSQTLDKALTLNLFDSVQATYNLLETTAEQALIKAKSQGLTIIIKESLANGRLTLRNTAPNFIKKMNIIKKIALQHNVGVDAVALAWIMNKPWVDVVLSGAASILQVEENIKASKITLSQAENEALSQLKEESHQYWSTRKNLVWN
jgi:aryl-alcohol dehydrogenase-like predicted oxidoreductase